jgi:predicted DNA binding protein
MWITKLQLRHEDCPIVNRCQKFNVIVFSYPSVWYEKKDYKYATTTCFFQSNDEVQKKKFVDDLKADRRITNLEVSGDIFTYEINLGKTGEHVMLYHTKQIFFVKPTVNHFDGHEYWEVAAWKKEELMKFIEDLKGHMDICNIQKIESSPLTDVYFPNVMPKLSKSQKKALEIAYLNGYYSYPRNCSLEDLSKIAGVAISTFQEHLRKGEMKLLPAIIEYQMKHP